jgi:hypothetical protein
MEIVVYLNFAAKLAKDNKEHSLTNFRIHEAADAFIKGNSYTQYITDKEWAKQKWLRRIRIILSVAFLGSALLFE